MSLDKDSWQAGVATGMGITEGKVTGQVDRLEERVAELEQRLANLEHAVVPRTTPKIGPPWSELFGSAESRLREERDKALDQVRNLQQLNQRLRDEVNALRARDNWMAGR